MSLRATADLSRCQGYANCVIAAPDVFDLDDKTGLVVVLQENPPDDREAAVREAARSCPVQAITLTEE